MDHSDALALISSLSLSAKEKQTWLDLGCGSGTFTMALAELLPVGSKIIAIDTEEQKLPLNSNKNVEISFLKRDMKDELEFDFPIHGIMMANAFHYVEDKESFLSKLDRLMNSRPRLVIVEYDTDTPNQWVPYPISYSNLQELFLKREMKAVMLGDRKSLYHGSMYAAYVCG